MIPTVIAIIISAASASQVKTAGQIAAQPGWCVSQIGKSRQTVIFFFFLFNFIYFMPFPPVIVKDGNVITTLFKHECRTHTGSPTQPWTLPGIFPKQAST